MKLATALLVSLAPAAFGQSSIVRSVTAQVTVSDEDFAQGAYTRNLFTAGGPLPAAPGLFGLPTLDGVRPVATQFDFKSLIVVRASLTNSGSSVVDDGLIAGDATAVAAGLGDTYGPLSFISSAALGNNFVSESFQPGETRTVEMFPLNNIVPQLLSIRYEPSSPLWCILETECPDLQPPYACELVLRDVGPWTGDCDLNWCEARVEHTSTVTADLELAEVTSGARPFCEATSTLAPVELRAFGSLAAGTNWLSMRVEGVPANAPVALVGASAITSVTASPMGICIGGSRLVQTVAIADPSGACTLDVDLIPFQPGDRIPFQALYRTPGAWDVTTGLLVEVQ